MKNIADCKREAPQDVSCPARLGNQIKKDPWPIERREQFVILEDLLREIGGLEVSNRFIDRILRIMALSEKLTDGDNNFMRFLKDQCVGAKDD